MIFIFINTIFTLTHSLTQFMAFWWIIHFLMNDQHACTYYSRRAVSPVVNCWACGECGQLTNTDSTARRMARRLCRPILLSIRPCISVYYPTLHCCLSWSTVGPGVSHMKSVELLDSVLSRTIPTSNRGQANKASTIPRHNIISSLQSFSLKKENSEYPFTHWTASE